MVPAITAGGRSFRGAALYYLHDKRREGEAERFTSGRVAWVETVNLPTGDPERAWRIMAHTALAQAELKAAAGTKATGRKLAKPVYAYSLAWHPEERPTKADMLDGGAGEPGGAGARGASGHDRLPQRRAAGPCPCDRQPRSPGNRQGRHPLEFEAETLPMGGSLRAQHGKIYCPQRVENKPEAGAGEFVRQPRTPAPAFEFDRAAGNDSLPPNSSQPNAEAAGRASLRDRAGDQGKPRPPVGRAEAGLAGSRKKMQEHGQTLKTGQRRSFMEQLRPMRETQVRAAQRAAGGAGTVSAPPSCNGRSLLREIRQNHEGNVSDGRALLTGRE